MDISEVYDKFIKEVENEEFNKLGEFIGYSVLSSAEISENNITYKQLKNIIEKVSRNKEINDKIDEKIEEELSKIIENEVDM